MKELFDIRRFKLYAWVGLAFTFLCIISEVSEKVGFFRSVGNNIWLSVYVTVVNYTLLEYTLPKFRWRKFISSFFRFLLYVFLYSSGLLIWARLGFIIGINTDFVTSHHQSDHGSEAMGYSMAVLVGTAIVRHIYLHVKLKNTAQQLRIEKQQAELNYLKAQTNPHFLFNTLNNIYSLARDKSDLAPESILRLSQILRYMLYDAGGQYIAIEQELKIIGDYISLEKLRYDDSLRINFNYDVEDMKQALPPLLLIPLVENAFKHGAAETRDRPFVDIHLSIVKRQLAFYVRNSTEISPENGTVKDNIGLSNLRRQLELLYTDYQVSVEQRAAEFLATLKINLSSHV